MKLCFSVIKISKFIKISKLTTWQLAKHVSTKPYNIMERIVKII